MAVLLILLAKSILFLFNEVRVRLTPQLIEVLCLRRAESTLSREIFLNQVTIVADTSTIDDCVDVGLLPSPPTVVAGDAKHEENKNRESNDDPEPHQVRVITLSRLGLRARIGRRIRCGIRIGSRSRVRVITAATSAFEGDLGGSILR